MACGLMEISIVKNYLNTLLRSNFLIRYDGPLYHVGNPNIKGKLENMEMWNYVPTSNLLIIFEEKVTFKGNPNRLDVRWRCSTEYLHRTSKEALANKLY